MAWIATDEDGECWIFENKPKRVDDYWSASCGESVLVLACIADKLTVTPLVWSDEALELV